MRLRDDREMVVRPATADDVQIISAQHPLPRDSNAPERVYRSYYHVKALLYTKAPAAGIMTGWVDERLAGFVFHCLELSAVRRFTTSPKTLLHLLGQAVRGRFGYSPRLWLDMLKWGLQHFRKPHGYQDPGKIKGAIPDIAAWIGTVHTVSDFRRVGVASHLLAYTERELADAGAAQVALWVAEDNMSARTLYEKRTYQETGIVQRVGETCVLMIKRL